MHVSCTVEAHVQLFSLVVTLFFFVLAAVLLGKQHVHEVAIVLRVTVILG